MQNKLEILFVNPHPVRTAGCNISLLSLLKSLDPTQIRAHVATQSHGSFRRDLDALGILAIDYQTTGGWFPAPIQLYQHLATMRERVMRLVSVIKTQRISLVYTNAEFAFEGPLAAALSNTPHIWAQRILFSADLDILSHFPLSEVALGELMIETSDRIVPNSPSVLRSFPSTIPASKLTLIESGLAIPESYPSQPDARTRLAPLAPIGQHSKLVLTIGRISPEKDLLTFVRTAAQVLAQSSHPDIHFVHAGNATVPPYLEEVRQACRALGIEGRVHFLGEIDPALINTLYRAADLVLFTSLSFEGFARVCAEAMLAGLPVVSTRCGGPEDYIQDHQTGFLCDVADVDALAQRTCWLLDNPREGHAMGARGSAVIAAHYDERIINKKWLNLFQEVMAEPRTPTPGKALRFELLINLLVRIGQAGIAQAALESRLRRTERLAENILGNRLARSIKKLLRPSPGCGQNK